MRFLRVFPIICFTIFLPYSAWSQEYLIESQNSIKQIDSVVEAFLDEWNIPGASVAIVKDDKLVYAKGYGYANVKIQEEVIPNHLFRIASVSKPITSVAILSLIEERKLRLEDQVFGADGVLSDFTFSDKRSLNITVYHLLTHSAGWNREVSGDPMFASVPIAKSQKTSSPADQTDIVKYVLDRPLDFAPGTGYAYSDFGYCLLGRIIEKVSGMPYDAFVKEEILAKCGITTVKIGQSRVTSPNEVTYYAEREEAFSRSVFNPKKKKSLSPYEGFYLEAMDAHGGWIASSVDLMKFLVHINGVSEKSDILSDKSIRRMTEPSPVNNNYALGWAVNSYNIWWHFGSLPGSSSMIARIHNGLGWCALLNKLSLKDDYFAALDQLMWNAIQDVKFNSDTDLFQYYP